MSRIEIDRQTRPNGFRLVFVHLPGRRSITSFLAIKSGSRHETAAENGIAHFLEHLVFKGTQKYPSNVEVANAIESVGGTLNAWTDHDHTAYWNIVPRSHADTGIELPFELAFRPKIRSADIERERGVITEEIRMIHDDPASFVRDVSSQLTFAGHPLAQPIIGTEETVAAMSHEQFSRYRQRFYVASQSVLVVAGDLTPEIIKRAEQLSDEIPSGEVAVTAPLTQPSKSQVTLRTKPTDQTHFVLATADPTLGLVSETDRHTLTVLNTILGRGMSSRLFCEVRERQGLAYSIHSYVQTFEDAAALSVYGGVTTEKADQALAAVLKELDRLCDEPVSAAELTNAHNCITGANDIQADSGMSAAMWYGTDWLLGRWETHDEVATKIRSVTPTMIQELAQRLSARDRLTLALIGPQTESEPFAGLLTKQ